MSPGAKLNLARRSDHAQPMGCAHWSPLRAPVRLDQILQLKGFARRCASKHRNSRRETAGWDRIDRQEVFVLCWKAGPSPNVGSAKGSGREVLADGHKPTQLPAHLISRLCLAAECLPASEVLAHGHHPGAIPGSRTNLLTGCASARGRVSKTQ